MDTLIINLPTELKNFMNEQIAKGVYANASDCFKQLLANEKACQECSEKLSESGLA